MQKMTLALLMLAIVALAGCGPIHTGPQISHNKLDNLVIGKTTKSEVIALFGELPSSQSRSGSGGSTLTWTHTRQDYNWWLGIYMPGASNVVTVVFDNNDIVRDYTFAGAQTGRELTQGSMGENTRPDLGVRQ